MPQQPNVPTSLDEARVILAIQAIKKDASLLERRAARLYKVNLLTLQRRLNGIAARRDCEANSKKLTPLEEEVIIKHILDIDARGYLP